MVAVSAGCECMGVTRGSSMENVLEMSVVPVGGVCEMCGSVPHGRCGGERIVFELSNPVGIGGVRGMCLCLGALVLGREVGGWSGTGSGRVGS